MRLGCIPMRLAVILTVLLLPSIGMTRPAGSVVVGSAEIHRLEGSGSLVGAVFPIAIYDGQFRKAALVADHERELQKLIPKSILNRIRDFDLHLNGKRLAQLQIRQIEGTPGCPSEIGGYGRVRPEGGLDFSAGVDNSLHVNARGEVDPSGTREGFRPTVTRMLSVDAVSGLPRQNQEFSARSQAVSPTELTRIKAVGHSRVRAAAGLTWGKVGRVTLRGEVLLEGLKAFDLDRDGIREIIVGFKAPLVKPKRSSDPGQPPPALILTMVVSIPARGQPQVMLSLPTLIGVDDASEFFDLSSVLDLTGDGVAELIWRHVYAPEYSGYEIFSMKEGVFRRVFSGDVTGC